MLRVSICIGVLALLAACSKPAPEVARSPDPVAVPDLAVAPPPPPPRPNYVIRDGDEYGYQPAVSERDRENGLVTNALVMYSYLGEHNGVHQVMHRDGDLRFVAECEGACMHVKVYAFDDGRFLKREIYALTPGMLLAEVMEDATEGRLYPLRGTRDGKLVQIWVDGEKKKVVHLPVATSPRVPDHPSAQ